MCLMCGVAGCRITRYAWTALSMVAMCITTYTGMFVCGFSLLFVCVFPLCVRVLSACIVLLLFCVFANAMLPSMLVLYVCVCVCVCVRVHVFVSVCLHHIACMASQR